MMLTAELLPNGLVYVRDRESGLTCCHHWSVGLRDTKRVLVGGKVHGDLTVSAGEVAVALDRQSGYQEFIPTAA
jgi:hypothetical protein